MLVVVIGVRAFPDLSGRLSWLQLALTPIASTSSCLALSNAKQHDKLAEQQLTLNTTQIELWCQVAESQVIESQASTLAAALLFIISHASTRLVNTNSKYRAAYEQWLQDLKQRLHGEYRQFCFLNLDFAAVAVCLS